MPMGALNTAPIFVAMTTKLKMEWETLAKELGKKCCIRIIVDDVLLYERTDEQLLDYFSTVLGVLKHHCNTLKLKNCKCFQDGCNFVGMDMEAGGTQPAQSQNKVASKLEQPNTWGDLCMLI